MKIATNQERLNELFDSDPKNDTAIAADLGVSRQTISAWRKGIRSPKKQMLIKMSEKYNVNIEWLMGFDVDRTQATDRTIVVPNTERFVKLVHYMPTDDYVMVMEAFERAEKRLKEEEEKQRD